MRRAAPLLQVLVKERPAAQERLQVRRQRVLDERLDRLRPRLLLEVHAVGVALVAALAVLPRHHRVVLERVEPGADKAVAALDLVVEERERQVAVHRLDPERQAAELHRQRVEVHAVDAALDDVAAEDGLEPRLEECSSDGPARELLGPEQILCLGRSAAIEQAHDGAVAGLRDAAVMMERGVERVGQEAQGRHRERARAAGRVADLEREDLFGRLRRPLRGRRIEIGWPSAPSAACTRGAAACGARSGTASPGRV